MPRACKLESLPNIKICNRKYQQLNSSKMNPNNQTDPNEDKENRILWAPSEAKHTHKRPDYPEHFQVESNPVSPRQRLRPEQVEPIVGNVRPLQGQTQTASLAPIEEGINVPIGTLHVHRDPNPAQLGPRESSHIPGKMDEEYFSEMEESPSTTRTYHQALQPKYNKTPLTSTSPATSGQSAVNSAKRSIVERSRKVTSVPGKFARVVLGVSEKLVNHLGLNHHSRSPGTDKTRAWVLEQEALLYTQVSLLPPENLQGHASVCYEDVKPGVMHLMEKDRYKYSPDGLEGYGYVLFFCDYAAFSALQEGARGTCLYLMTDYPNTGELVKIIEKMVSEHNYGQYLHVIVQKGTPSLYGHGDSATPPKKHKRKTYRRRPTPDGFEKPSRSLAKRFEDLNACSRSVSPVRNDTTPDRIPSPPAVDKTIYKTEHHKYKQWPNWHYGLRWITNIPIPDRLEGQLIGWKKYPDIGDSIGHADDKGTCGTLGGYLVDPEGTTYALSAYHVFVNGGPLYKPAASNSIQGHHAVCPANCDYFLSKRQLVRQRISLLRDLNRAQQYEDFTRADEIIKKGRKVSILLKEQKQGLKHVDRRFGSIHGSVWKFYSHPEKGSQLVDMTLIKVRPSRLGTNTFDYYGSDKPYSHHYRLEAKGWGTPEVGDDVLKVGRSTGLTRGKVISTMADMRICTGRKDGKPELYFWSIKSHIVTNGTGPWFSEAGDSGAFILRAPDLAKLRDRDFKKHLANTLVGPDPVPVLGLLFGGVDSCEGVHLTFFSPSSLQRAYLKKMVGVPLVPGIYHEADDDASDGLKKLYSDIGLGPEHFDPATEDCDLPDDHPFNRKISMQEYKEEQRRKLRQKSRSKQAQLYEDDDFDDFEVAKDEGEDYDCGEAYSYADDRPSSVRHPKRPPGQTLPQTKQDKFTSTRQPNSNTIQYKKLVYKDVPCAVMSKAASVSASKKGKKKTTLLSTTPSKMAIEPEYEEWDSDENEKTDAELEEIIARSGKQRNTLK